MSKIEDISFSFPESHPKKWGNELWVTNNEKYCCKILKFNCGAKFSFHMHAEKDETWFVADGELVFEYRDLSIGEKVEKVIKKGDVIRIPPMNPHRLTALKDSSIIEVSTTHHEHDSYRIEGGDSQE